MSAHTAVEFYSDGTGTTYSISAGLPVSYDGTGYASTTTGFTYTLIGKPKTFPQFGLKRALQEWTPISGDVEKGAGPKNYGGGQSTWGHVAADAGQAILASAAVSGMRHSMKLTFPDGALAFLEVIILSDESSAASGGSPFERLCDIQLCRAPVVVAAV